MKKQWIILSTMTALGLFNLSAAYAGVGVSVSIGQPGFYGQLDIGDYYPRPQLVYAEPRVVYVEPAYRYAAPIYLHVPPGQIKNWANHCGQYGACGRPVYFVQDGWYQQVYSPRYVSYHEHGDDGRRYDHAYWQQHGHGGHNGPPGHPGHPGHDAHERPDAHGGPDPHGDGPGKGHRDH